MSSVLTAREFRAMNTDIRIVATGGLGPLLLARAETTFHNLEARLSRFLPDSELSRLNLHSGVPVRVSRELFRVVRLAALLHRRTRGTFDPAILPALEAAGYDRSFQLVQPCAAAPASPVGRPRSFKAVRLRAAGRLVALPAGMRLDLGGIGKGYAVDRAVAVMAPARNYLVDAGGDIFAAGSSPAGAGWTVSVADPFSPERDVALLRLQDEALATSTTAVRRWQRGGSWQHHLIDPRTGRPAATDIVSASVVARTTAEAEVFAKCALIRGSEQGLRFLERLRLPGLLMLGPGACRESSSWRDNLDPEGATP
jgi:thiamine biosynthesis lipoprotein